MPYIAVLKCSHLPSKALISTIKAQLPLLDFRTSRFDHIWRSVNDLESRSSSDTPPSPRHEADRHNERTRGRILIVEDESIVAMDIRNTLQNCGHIVTGLAASGQEAILQARMNKPELILMDIRLKGTMDGIEAAEVISLELNIPIIFMTAQADAATRSRAELAKPAGYLVKPFIPNEMITLIKIVLSNRTH